MQAIKRIIGFVFKYGAIAWVAALFVWYLIVSTLRQGISCDEGYYLMGYLRNQSVEGIGTDFHSIVRALCRPFADDNIMVFRYLRLILNGLAIVAFAGSSYEWLSRKKGLRISRWAYYPMVLLAGAMSFTFAAPTISYDSIELVIVLLTASLSFMLFSTDKNVVKSICAFGIGFLLWFACTNYPPAGVCMVALFVLAYSLEASDKRWSHLVMAILGVFLAMVINHFFIHDLKDWFSGISKVFVSTFTEESKSRHDAGSLISVMLGTVAKVLLVFLPMVVLFTFLYKKIHLSEKILWGIVLLLCVVLIVFRRIYELRGLLFPIPVALMLAKVLAQPEFKLKQFLLSKEAFFVLVLIAIPFAGVFGTNQPILKKVIIYVPFWLVAFSYLSAQLRTESNERLDLLFVVLLLAGYVWLGNFQRYHYYYTPRSSRYEIVGASRPQKVLVSQYQQQYYSDLMDTLKTAGCKPGDKFMAFGENQITVYLAGGVIDGLLPYHWWQYKSFAKDAPQAFVLFKTEEESVIDYFRQTEWNFPENYERMEMRPISQNLGDDYRTVVYTRLTH
jgi:hypothetical protein